MATTTTTLSSAGDDWSLGPLHDRYDSLVKVPLVSLSATTTTATTAATAMPIRCDAIQLKALQALERLRHDLSTYPPPTSLSINNSATSSRSSSRRLSGWFNSHSWMEPPTANNTSSLQQQQHHHPPLIRGVYLHGGVGCGKTFLMNRIFCESLENNESAMNANLQAWKQQRHQVHFYKFMARVHQEMHRARKATVVVTNASSSSSSSLWNGKVATKAKASISNDDLWPSVIYNIAQQGRLILLDEFQVTDVADALLLQRLFTGLWDDFGCVVVATSNRPPHDLYQNGLQRDRFVPFIEQLTVHCQVTSMWESSTDYRLVLHQQDNTAVAHAPNKDAAMASSAAGGGAPPPPPPPAAAQSRNVFFVGNKAVWKEFDALFYQLAGSAVVATPLHSGTHNRTIAIPQASRKGVCRFSFEELCQKALGASDYLLIGQHYHTVFVEYLPLLRLEHLNWVRRFIIFVDAMYECHVKLVLYSATVAPTELFEPAAQLAAAAAAAAAQRALDKNATDAAGSSGASTAAAAATCKDDDDASFVQQHHDEVFAFARTASRLQEMSSQMYLQQQRRRNLDHHSPESERP
jgi:peroxisome-assembly ATPase